MAQSFDKKNDLCEKNGGSTNIMTFGPPPNVLAGRGDTAARTGLEMKRPGNRTKLRC